MKKSATTDRPFIERNVWFTSGALAICLCSALCLCPQAFAAKAKAKPEPVVRPAIVKPSLNDIEHFVIIVAENRSFDNLFGLFPGANGIKQATKEQYTQVDNDGKAFKELPPIWAKEQDKAPLFERLPNNPFRIDSPPVNLPLSAPTRDLVHRFYQHIEQIDGGKNDKFAAVSDAGGLAMGYYDGSKLQLWKMAQDYVLADNFFMAAYGGSFLNHQWLICACTPRVENAPDEERAELTEQGLLKRKDYSPPSAMFGAPKFEGRGKEGVFTPDGYAVGTKQPPYQPSGITPAKGGDLKLADPSKNALPPQTAKTIGDTLSAKNVSWAWYAGAWKQAQEDGQQEPDVKRNIIYSNQPGSLNFQPHHQPFNYFARFAPGSVDRDIYLKDAEDLLTAIDSDTLPQVAFYKPAGHFNQHPGYSDILSGDQHIADVVDKIQKSKAWSKTAIIITYDENGGFWDHVAPPKGDRWGPATRIPTLVISPFARKHFVDHTVYDTTSIIKLLTLRFGLEPLPGVRPNVGDLSGAFQFE